MKQTDKIEQLAEELNIDSGTSYNQADRLKKIAEAVGLEDYNSLYDNDKLEKMLWDLYHKAYPNIEHIDATNNSALENEMTNFQLRKPTSQNNTVSVSPKRANSLVPGEMQGVYKPEEVSPEAEPSQDSSLNNVDEDDIEATDLKAEAPADLLKLIAKHPQILGIIGMLFGGLMIIIAVLVILSCFMASDAKSSASSSSGNGTVNSASVTDSCSQLEGKSLSDALSEKNSTIDDFNKEISSSIASAGLGTREGVVAAALSITSDLCSKYNIRLPYEWGGGHSTKIELASGQWGSKLASPIYANDRSYNYSGLDCSGFVSWAIYNGGYNFPLSSSEDFSKYGKTHSMTNDYVAKAGDLIHHPGHIMIIVGVNESSKQYTVAEAAGGDEGMRVRTMPFDGGGSNNSIIDMTEYYSNSANVGG